MANSLIVALVPEVEPYVAALRERFDPAAKRGLGAHITLRHAPLPAAGIDAAMIGAVSAVAAATEPFSFTVTGVARFPGTLYLAVEPAAPFVELNRRLVQRLPVEHGRAAPPGDLVPHISVVRRGSGADLAGPEVRDAERRIAEELACQGPTHCNCRELLLLEDSTGRWQPVRSFRLSGGKDIPSPAPS